MTLPGEAALERVWALQPTLGYPRGVCAYTTRILRLIYDRIGRSGIAYMAVMGGFSVYFKLTSGTEWVSA